MLDSRDHRLKLRSYTATNDKSLFFVMFVAGAAATVTAKLLGLPLWVPMLTSVGALALYAAIAWRITRFCDDRAGDSMYYLGFLYTLVSLAYALWEFSGEGQLESVIANFAVALVSTIAGLVLRITFQQSEDEPGEEEYGARLELSESVRRVSAELLLTVEDLSAVRLRLRNELHDEFGAAVREVIGERDQAVRAQLALARKVEALIARLDAPSGHLRPPVRVGTNSASDSRFVNAPVHARHN